METTTQRIVIDIDGMPTAIIPRGENQLPIILYTLPPPPYYKHAEFELIDTGPPAPLSQIINDDNDGGLFWLKCVIMLAILVVMVVGTGLILINW